LASSRNYKWLLFVLLSVLILPLAVMTACSNGGGTTKLIIFAAAGAKPAIDDVCQTYEQRYPCKLEIGYGGGGEMLSRMMLSKAGDVYIAPEQRFMESAEEKQAIFPDTMMSIAYMIPVIAVRKGNPTQILTLTDLARPGVRVAITRPETSLLGKYAPEIFQKAGLSEAIEKNIVTHASDPNNLLTMLTMGQIDAGITWHFYQSLASDTIDVIFLSPEQLTGVGEMEVAVSAYSTDIGSAKKFVSFVSSAEGKEIFKKHGYIVDPEEVKKYWR